MVPSYGNEFGRRWPYSVQPVFTRLTQPWHLGVQSGQEPLPPLFGESYDRGLWQQS